MKKSRFSEEQIIGILKEHQAGRAAKELFRKHGVSDATCYRRSKSGGMEVYDARKLKALEAEKDKLNRKTVRKSRTTSILHYPARVETCRGNLAGALLLCIDLVRS